MHKTNLIIKREYLSRVKKKSFLLLTFLVPILLIGIWAGSIYLATQDSDTLSTVTVIDDSGLFQDELKDSETLQFQNANQSIEGSKAQLTDKKAKDHYLLIIPKNVLENQGVELYASSKFNLFVQDKIKDQLNEIMRIQQLKHAGINPQTLDAIQADVRISSKELTVEGEKDSSMGAAMGVSMASSILIYLTLFIYGSQVMRGVIEEKNNRIVEIVISSVRPFQLMMGKIIGIGLVGLTQFLLWIILFMGLSTLLLGNMDMGGMQDMSQVGANPEMQAGLMQEVQVAIGSLDWAYILACFLFFFLGGYLIYSALFAMVGSAVDNETETQQFMFPLTLPLLFTYMMSFGVLLKDPHGTLAFWLSMIPFTSPIGMMVRIPFGVPTWELLLSMGLLIAGFLLSTYVAARIYRVGILMYGKKASYKELMKWFKYKN